MSRLWQYGIPFMIFILGGSFGLREFTELRYRYKGTTEVPSIRDELEKKGIQTRPLEEITLEKEYEKLQKVHARIVIQINNTYVASFLKVDLDNWQNIRIPRPWEESESTKV